MLWSRQWEDGKELQVTERAKAKLVDTLRRQGCLLIAIDDATKELLE